MKIRGQRVIPHDERIRSLSVCDGETGCWNWTGAVRSEKRPYGRLIIGSRSDGSRKSIGAHQLSYITFRGEIPDGLCVCHHCDNPRCVNPDHLFLGSKKENADDRDRKGRNVPAPVYRGSAAPWAKLTEAQVAEIRASTISSYKIAPTYNISDGQIRAIRRGKHYPPPPATP